MVDSERLLMLCLAEESGSTACSIKGILPPDTSSTHMASPNHLIKLRWSHCTYNKKTSLDLSCMCIWINGLEAEVPEKQSPQEQALQSVRNLPLT